jgi:Tol biopolymer transport system component
VAFALLLARATDAQYFGQNKVQYRRFDFRILQTAHFDIYYYPSEQEAVYQAARMAERWYDHLSRVLGHTLRGRQPLVLYACHPDFAQTNVVAGSPGEGTGGFTESDRNRVVLPFGPSLAETNHVLGHELVHAFQYDIARHGNPSVVLMPLWFIEGMAEYLSIGGMDPQTAMWMRDAVRQNKLPSIKDLVNPRFFPYRYGQAVWSYLARRFGEDVVARLLKACGEKVATRLKAITGVSAEQLSKDWHASLRAEYALAKEAGAPKQARADAGQSEDEVRRVITAKTGGRLNVGPALSPDGNEIMFLSERDRFSVDMFVADAHTGAIKRTIVSTATDPHFDSLEFIDSAGAWDPTGRQFAFTAVRGGGAVLVVVDARTGDTVREARLGDIGQAFNATWSPDGTRLAFSGLNGGVTDLYAYDLKSGELTAFTHDVFADFQPAWSPDGKTIAFVTDRFSTDLRNLEFGNYRLALLDVASGDIEALPGLRDGRNLDPHWAPDGRSLFFAATSGGLTNIYRLDVRTSQILKVTDLWNGVAGLTPMSPVLSVAADRQALVFSAYRDGGYEIQAIDDRERLAGRLVPIEATTSPGVLPLVEMPARPAPLVDNTLASLGEAAVKRYRKTLSLNRVGTPYFSAGGGSFGTFIQAGMGLSWADMLGDQQMDLQLQVGRRRDDFAGQAVYVNRSRRVNLGVAIDYLPALFARSESTFFSAGDTATRQTDFLRQIHTGASGLVFYPFNRARRLEFSAGLEHVTFARETNQQIFSLASGKLLREENSTVRAASPITFAQTSAAFVEDTAVFGPTSPILGTRYRFEIAPAMGGLNFTTVLADYRRYVMPVRPFTIAMRARYVSRFGADATDPRLLPLVWTLRDQVRGYDLQSMVTAPCASPFGMGCAAVNLLDGSRLFVGNVELRFPLLGTLNRSFTYGPLPLEGIVFLDTGSLWTRQGAAGGGAWSQHLMRSVGAGVRINAGGMVFELAAVRPFDRPDKKGWTISFNVLPGF